MDKLQWGNRKAPRRLKMKDSSLSAKSNGGGGGGAAAGVSEKKMSSRVVDDNSNRHRRDLAPVLSPHLPNSRKAPMASLPVKEEGCYAKRGFGESSSSKVVPKEETQKYVWPRLLISLSNKEKEEDFMQMKGCKPSQRPKKRAKLIQRAILLVSPGAWLSDVCRERYEVREKKTSKKKPRGLKAMGGMDIDSE